MRLDSVREIKARALEQIVEPMLMARPQSLGLAYAAAPLENTRRSTRLFALGVSPAGKGNFKLAIRLQRHSLAARPEIARLTTWAKGEVDARFIGRVQKRAAPWYQRRCRPLNIGCSIAHAEVTAGTLGGFVTPRRGGDIQVLSNNHVLANENNAQKGDAILQAGPYDGGKAADRVATLANFVRLRRSNANRVDCATATLVRGVPHDPGFLRGLGRLKGLASPELDEGLRVAKVGRTTGVTRGRVTAFELDDVVVSYDIGNVGFDGQIEIEGEGGGPFSDGGDSGSLIVDRDGYAVAQLFAGTDSGGRNGAGLTYASPIHAVLDALKVNLIY
jgi:hypothetical protein